MIAFLKKNLFLQAGLAFVFLMATSLPALSAESFRGEINVCHSPSINCDGFDNARFDGGRLSVKIRNRGHDDRSFKYQVDFSNNSNCKITIGTTMMRHGDTLNAETLDFGNIDLAPGKNRESAVKSFTPSHRESEKLVFVKFTYNGIAECPR